MLFYLTVVTVFMSEDLSTFLLFSNQYFQLFPFIPSDIHPYFILTTTPPLSDSLSLARSVVPSLTSFLCLPHFDL